MRHVKTEHHALKASRALVIGVGGLGSPAAIALAEAGVGTIGLIDPDRVELSNLHRQPLYTDGDIGAPKVRAAAARLQAVRPGVQVHHLAGPLRPRLRRAARRLRRAPRRHRLGGRQVRHQRRRRGAATAARPCRRDRHARPAAHRAARPDRVPALSVRGAARPRRGAVLRGGRSARALRRARRQPAGARRRSACSPAPERCSPAACSRSTCGMAPGAACRWRRAPRVSPAASCIGKFSRKGA